MSPPSSRSPAGLPASGGNAKYAVVAVVLLLAGGGLLAWRSMSAHTDAPAPPPPAPSVAQQAPAPTNPKLDDIPPPPPADTTPEAGPGRVVYVQGASASGCEAKTCAGTAPPELEQALAVRGAMARRCYNQALASDSTLKGRVSISVRVGANGSVCAASVAANDMGTPAVANCAANVFRSGSYPAPRGGCKDAVVPLSFVPMGQ